MLKYAIFSLGLMVGGTIGLASSAIAQPPAPVIRASGFSPQVPACYIETTSSGFQNLDAACLMGKVPEAQMFDMVTDRDNDGVPDDLVPLFKQMAAMNKISSSTPEGRAFQVTQMKQVFQTMAQRTPIAAATRRNLNEMGETMAALSTIKPGVETDKKLMQQYERLGQLSQQLDKDPVLNKLNAYSRRYGANQAMKK
jgi:hypothetical protein